MFYRSNKWRSGAVRGPASARKAAIRSNQKQDSPNQTPFRRTQPQPCKITLQAFPPKVALIGTIWMAAALLLHRPRGTGTASGGPRLRGQEWNATNLPWDSGGVLSKSFFHQDVASVLALGLATPGLLIEAEICWLIAIHRERCGCSPEQKSLQLHRQKGRIQKLLFFSFISLNPVTVTISGHIPTLFGKSKFHHAFAFAGEERRRGLGRAGGYRGSRFGTLQATRQGSQQEQQRIAGIYCISTPPTTSERRPKACRGLTLEKLIWLPPY